MSFSIIRFIEAIPQSLRRVFTIRFDKSPVETVDTLAEFVQTRAAYVAQTSLYGYIKTRMGTRYRYMFEDETYAASINFAKWRTYASCLSDLAVFAAATAATRDDLKDTEAAELARFCFNRSVERAFDDVDDPALPEEIVAAFSIRAAGTNWDEAALGENAFEKSPVDLIRWAPIADELKEFDSEIVINSTRFRWRDIREQLRTRIDGGGVCADWRENGGSSAAT